MWEKSWKKFLKILKIQKGYGIVEREEQPLTRG